MGGIASKALRPISTTAFRKIIQQLAGLFTLISSFFSMLEDAREDCFSVVILGMLNNGEFMWMN